jgi:hypothetical protein
MQEPAIFRIVDNGGRVHHQRLTSSAADAFMGIMLASGQFSGLRSEAMDAQPAFQTPLGTPALVIAATAEAAVAKAIKDIEPGQEREALREAIETHLDTAARLDSANQSVERAAAFVAARQSELDAMTAAHQSEIEASGANLAEALKAGAAAFDASRLIDRSAVLDAEVRRDTARAALDRLTAEQTAAAQAYTSAETGVRLAVMAVKRADVEGMVRRLQDVKTEYMALATAIDGARFSDVPTTQEAQEAMHIDAPHAGLIDAAAKVWGRYSAALRDDPDALREDFA